MTLTDTLLNQLAGVVNEESFTAPTHVGFSSTVIIIDPTDISLSGEYGNRVAVTGTRNLNEVNFSGVRSGAVVSSSGDAINSYGLFNSSTAGDLHSEALVTSVLQTTSFDIEVDWLVKITRRD